MIDYERHRKLRVELYQVRKERDQLQAAKENAVQQAQTWACEARAQQAIVKEIYRAIGFEGGDWNGARPVVDALRNLAEVLSINTHRTTCPDCERYLVDGEPHDKQCKYSPVMAMAEKILEGKPSPTLDEVLDAVGFNPFKPLCEPLGEHES